MEYCSLKNNAPYSVFIKSEEAGFSRSWEPNAIKRVPMDKMKELVYDRGVEVMLREGTLSIIEPEALKELGFIKEENGELPKPLTENDYKLYLGVMSMDKFEETMSSLMPQQVRIMAQYAIDNQLAVTYEKSEYIRKNFNVDILKSIELNKKDEE